MPRKADNDVHWYFPLSGRRSSLEREIAEGIVQSHRRTETAEVLCFSVQPIAGSQWRSLTLQQLYW